jgi:hypothetical protein
MSNLWISAKSTYTPGPQSQTITESQKIQGIPAITTPFDYSFHAISDTESESQKIQATPAVTALNYA